jgi:hypothetical protein
MTPTPNTQMSEWEKEFDDIQNKQRYTDYTSERFCCGGDYCEGDHLGYIKSFISQLLTSQRTALEIAHAEECKKHSEKAYADGYADGAKIHQNSYEAGIEVGKKEIKEELVKKVEGMREEKPHVLPPDSSDYMWSLAQFNRVAGKNSALDAVLSIINKEV